MIFYLFMYWQVCNHSSKSVFGITLKNFNSNSAMSSRLCNKIKHRILLFLTKTTQLRKGYVFYNVKFLDHILYVIFCIIISVLWLFFSFLKKALNFSVICLSLFLESRMTDSISFWQQQQFSMKCHSSADFKGWIAKSLITERNNILGIFQILNCNSRKFR